jgi:two-component system, response regulator YesN
MAVRADTRKRRQQVLRLATRWLRDHLTEPDLSLEDLAEGIDVSPRQLQRIFREEGGRSFRDYLLRIRMERAKQLVSRDPPLPTTLVAPLVGYRGSSGLRQAFKRYHGKNPSEFHPPRALVPGIDIPPENGAKS